MLIILQIKYSSKFKMTMEYDFIYSLKSEVSFFTYGKKSEIFLKFYGQ